jgi:2-polyprenyl-3-methyl-5-hydroxy-6-metoxy-1,4-benzoquinol methylase
MNQFPDELRKEREREHGRFLAPRAEWVWGWGTPAGKLRAQRRAQLLIQRAGITPGSRVLELGCGTGLFTRLVAETGAFVVAIDLSEELIAAARSQSSANVEFLVGDVERVEFADAVFDSVFGSSILHHVDAARSLREAFRLLKPGGSVAFAEPNMLNPQIAIQKNIPWVKKMLGDSPDETAFFRWKARRLLQSCGFDRVEAQPFDFLHPSVPSSLIGIVQAFGGVAERIPILREIAGSIILWGRKPKPHD